MNRRLYITASLVLSCIVANAQVYILNENIYQERMSEIKVTVLDSLTNEPVGFASVYVIPAKDTVITNFTMTDANGQAGLEEVPFGSYTFHVEMMGYRPFVRECYFRERNVDIGRILLQQDGQFLQAAVVSDIGNPIVVKQDTVEFNASSFRVGANAMLKDLLQRMPGMEITDDGKVKFNGEEIDKLTVGGRTFFFNDQGTALNNLPASVVDKIRVIDRESEQTRASGIYDGSREKVLDVGLKKEYEKGWFGNVGARGGATTGKKDGNDDLRDNRGFLWSGNALVSAYTEKDQVTVIGNAQNVNDSNGVIVIVNEDGEYSSPDNGLYTAAQLGINANTSRIKDVETTVSANYKYSDSDSRNRSERTTWQEGGNLSSSSESSGKSYANSLAAALEMKKETGKVWFHLDPEFRFSRMQSFSASSSETSRESEYLNRSENTVHGLAGSWRTSIDADVTFREIGGRKGRTVRLDIGSYYTEESSESDENSLFISGSSEDIRALNYLTDGFSAMFMGGLRYTEPVGENWTLSAMATYSWSWRNQVRDAFDAAGQNEYYSSESRSDYHEQQYDLTAQYKFGTGSLVTLGGRLVGSLNETFSRSYGIEQTTGKDEWNWFVTPTIRFQHSAGNSRLGISVFGYSIRPSASRMLPVLNITDPARLSLGNVYLKPHSQTYFNANWTRNNRERFSNLMVYLYGSATFRPVSSAMWYDGEGVLYSVPVNSTRPTLSSSLTVNYTTPVDPGKLWFLTVRGAAGYSSSVSYQSQGTLSGIDKETFDYSAFMEDFWGNDVGDRFYGGESGFSESRTQVFRPSAGITVRFNPEHWSLRAGASTTGSIARYSLDPRADMNTLDIRFTASGSYTTKHEFEFETDLSYVIYIGYAEGYGCPEWQWNAEISKNIGAFNLSVKVNDILNRTRNLTHTVTANYEEDSYRLVMGRYVLFGLKWNFGKMNAIHSQRAQQAAMEMVF